MEIEIAIKTALQYENRVVGVYREAARSTLDAAGKRMFETLVREEESHVRYLEHKLDEWKRTGHVVPERLTTLIPSVERIEEGVKKLHDRVATPSCENELKLLKRALEVEVETGTFYRSIVRELSPEGQMLFQRFIEIEEGHQKIVQAAIDSVTGLGFWFDMQEFNLESG